MLRCGAMAIVCVCAAACLQAAHGVRPMDISIETSHLRLGIGSDARVGQFVDKSTGADYASEEPIAAVKKAGQVYPASAASFSNGRLELQFGEAKVSAVVGVTAPAEYLTFEVTSLSGEQVEEFAFVDIPLKLKGTRNEPFAACALALNLKTNVVELPRASSRLRALCYPRFGFVGARAAIIGCPTPRLRGVMQGAVSAAPDLPKSSLGGPWALDAPVNRGSYLFNFGWLTESSVDEWIELARSLGITQIDFHGGSSFRFGDCAPHPEWYPQGRASLKAVIDKLHAAGILAGLHTYAFFIDKGSPWVTPVPDPGLGKDATFTLKEAISDDGTSVVVRESTKGMSTTTGFFVRNSVTLQIDDELIVYTGISKDPPYAFTGCQRGAYGTRASAHAAGAKVRHLKECFGLFTPDPDSELFTKVAQATADFYNECGFDMIYLDALDGEDILGGGENGWHYGSAFVFELAKRLDRPAIMEMSTFHHHLWYVRSRMGAWDHPGRSHKKFIDIHCEANEACYDMFLPAHLGWWRILGDGDPRLEATFSDGIEYLCAKCAAHDCGLSPQGFTPEEMAKSYNLRRLGAIIKRWEDLRRAGFFSGPMREKLKVPGDEYTLVEESGKPRLRPVRYAKHKVEGLGSPSSRWTVTNDFAPQPARLRIEALMSAGPYDAPDNVTLADFGDTKGFSVKNSAPGITMEMQTSTDIARHGTMSGLITASRATADDSVKRGESEGPPFYEHGFRAAPSDDASWAMMGTRFAPTLDLTAHRAFGVWVHGDGKGEVVNFQTASPHHVSGGLGDHYVVVDFAGWRYFELIEPEGDRIDDYNWPYSGNLYAIYRELVNPAQVESLNIWCNNLPEDGPATVYLSPVKALPLVETKLVNPSISIGGRKITFPVELASGCYLEYDSITDCRLYNARGDLLAEVTPRGDAPMLAAGENEVRFDCDPPANGANARARVTMASQGEALGD